MRTTVLWLRYRIRAVSLAGRSSHARASNHSLPFAVPSAVSTFGRFPFGRLASEDNPEAGVAGDGRGWAPDSIRVSRFFSFDVACSTEFKISSISRASSEEACSISAMRSTPGSNSLRRRTILRRSGVWRVRPPFLESISVVCPAFSISSSSDARRRVLHCAAGHARTD